MCADVVSRRVGRCVDITRDQSGDRREEEIPAPQRAHHHPITRSTRHSSPSCRLNCNPETQFTNTVVRRGRPRKRKRSNPNAGRPRSAKTVVTPAPSASHPPADMTPLSIETAIAKAKEDSLCTPDFIPKPKRKPNILSKTAGCSYVMISGTRHTLTKDLPNMPRRGRCAICYKFSTKKNSNRSKYKWVKVKTTRYGCDKCNRMMCQSCFDLIGSHGDLLDSKSFLYIP